MLGAPPLAAAEPRTARLDDARGSCTADPECLGLADNAGKTTAPSPPLPRASGIGPDGSRSAHDLLTDGAPGRAHAPAERCALPFTNPGAQP